MGNYSKTQNYKTFKEYVYGEIPNKEINISYKLVEIDKNALEGKAIQKEVIVTFSNGKESLEMNILLFLPKKVKKPVPIFLGLNFYGIQSIHPNPNITITSSYVKNNDDFHIENNKATESSRGIRSSRWP